MWRKATYYQSAFFAIPKILALAATVALISSAPIARAATLTTGTDPSAVPIGTTGATVTGNTVSGPMTVSAPAGDQFSDLTFTVSASTPFIGQGTVTVTGTGSDGASASNSFQGCNGIVGVCAHSFIPVTNSQDFTFTATTPLTSVEISTAVTPIAFMLPSVTAISASGISGLEPIPLPASFPLFASGLGALGLLGWRRKRRAQAVA